MNTVKAVAPELESSNTSASGYRLTEEILIREVIRNKMTNSLLSRNFNQRK